jgi:hypothetical protein
MATNKEKREDMKTQPKQVHIHDNQQIYNTIYTFNYIQENNNDHK